jgi:peptidoglycan/LPS O-acetylase OafA/YrhL
MSAGQGVLRLLEAVCAVAAMLLALLLALSTDYEHLRAAYDNGALTQVVIAFVLVCGAWFILWRRRTGRRMSAWPAAALLAGGACVLVLVALGEGGPHGHPERHIVPTTIGTAH